MALSATLEVMVSKLLRLSKSSIYSQVQEGTFPAQIQIGVRAVAWLESDIEEWMLHRVEARNAADKKTELNDEV
jgi:prophage regulatory protein